MTGARGTVSEWAPLYSCIGGDAERETYSGPLYYFGCLHITKYML